MGEGSGEHATACVTTTSLSLAGGVLCELAQSSLCAMYSMGSQGSIGLVTRFALVQQGLKGTHVVAAHYLVRAGREEAGGARKECGRVGC